MKLFDRTAISFSLSSIFMTGSTVISGIILIRWLQPGEIGLWNSFSVLLPYALFFQLGIFNGLNRELPFYLGKGNQQTVNDLVASASWLSRLLVLLSVLVLPIVLLVYIFFFNDQKIYIISILAIGIMIAAQFSSNFLTVTFRARQSFDQLSKAYILQGILILVSLFMIYKWKYEGMLIRAVLLSITLPVMLYVIRPFRVSARFIKKPLNLLIKTGLPLFSFAYVQGITRTLSRIVLLSVSGVLAVGYYSPALAILTAMKLLPSILGQYLYPQMSYQLGQGTDPKLLWKWVWKSSLGLILILTPVGIIGWFIIPWLIRTYFTRYTEGIFATQLAVVSGILSGAIVGFNVLNSLKSWKWLTFLTVIKFMMNYGFMKFFATKFNPVDGVSIGLLISDFLYLILGLWVCYKALKNYRNDIEPGLWTSPDNINNT
jgi:O-antigen/teichoic acid export membrane protein